MARVAVTSSVLCVNPCTTLTAMTSVLGGDSHLSTLVNSQSSEGPEMTNNVGGLYKGLVSAAAGASLQATVSRVRGQYKPRR